MRDALIQFPSNTLKQAMVVQGVKGRGQWRVAIVMNDMMYAERVRKYLPADVLETVVH